MKRIELYKYKKECCGCGSCKNICPQKAINMQVDEDGFIYPVLDAVLCVKCHQCKQVCAYQRCIFYGSIKEAYVAVSLNTDITESASGGVFSSFAKNILNEGGVVYGASMIYENARIHVRHISISSVDDLIKLKGSKYVQSDLGNSYHDIKYWLDKGQTVLFSGTPCQVAGLHGFLQKKYDNLYTLELVCHGVPSIKMFQDYISYTEKKANGKIIDFRFRDKSSGWKFHGQMTVEKPDGTIENVFFEPEQSSYYQLFLNSYTYRENCYSCPYASENRPGDITIGDYWCVELVHPELMKSNGGPISPERGVSCMIINNEHGRELLQRFGRGILRFESTYEQAAKYNGQLKRPSELKPEREEVFKVYAKGYEYLEKWYQRRLFPIKARRAIIKAIPEPVKKALKSVLHRTEAGR